MVRDEYNHTRPVFALIRDWLLYNKAGGGGGILKTVTGNPISVSDALAAPIQSLSVSLSPIQTGSGDPSPDNIRPITGRDSVTVERTGKNLLDTSVKPDNIVIGGIARKGWDLNLPSGTYTIMYHDDEFASYVYCRVMRGDVNIGANIYVTTTPTTAIVPRTFTIPEGCHLQIYKASATGGNIQDKKIMLEVGESTSDYQAYSGQTVTIPLGQTVYGGTVDFTTGVLTVEWENIASYDGEALPGEWISDRDAYAPGTTPTTGAQVCYKLATPITIDLTSAQLTTLKGDNTVWSDGDDISMTYKAASS